MTEPDPEEQTTEPVEPRTYSQEEYDALKEESIKNRKKAGMTSTLREALEAATIREATRNVLVNPNDLKWDDSFNADDGLPDLQKVRDAAVALVSEHPHLGRVRGDAGQGVRDQSVQNGDIHGLLRSLI